MQYMREDWVKAGLGKLAEVGIHGVRVEVLAREMKISKGSFYHHFQDRQDLLDAMIDYWEDHATERIIRNSESDTSTLEHLLEFVFTGDKKIETAMYAWAKENHTLGQRITEIENRRIDHIAELYQKKGLSPSEAAARAHLAYLVYLGWLVRREINTAFDIQSAMNHLLKC